MGDILITGATGFIGFELSMRLLDEGYEVDAFARHVSTRNKELINKLTGSIHLIKGDVTDYQSIISALKQSQPRYFIHLAALTPVRLSFENPFPYAEVNYKGTINVAQAILDYNPKIRLISASTMEVYGWQSRKKPFMEDQQLNPASPYAVSKAAADLHLQMMRKVYNLPITILRPSNTYGRKYETGFIVEYIITTMLHNGIVYIGAPESTRDYMHVNDHVSAYLSIIKKGCEGIFNVSTGTGYSNRQLAETIAGILGFKGKIVYGSYPPNYPKRPSFADPPYLVMNSGKLTASTGWKPKYSLREGLKATISFWRTKIRGQ